MAVLSSSDRGSINVLWGQLSVRQDATGEFLRHEVVKGQSILEFATKNAIGGSSRHRDDPMLILVCVCCSMLKHRAMDEIRVPHLAGKR